VHFERRPRPHTFQHRESGLAGKLRRADLDLEKFFFVERQDGPGMFFGRRRRRDIVVDAGDVDMPLRVFQLGEQLHQTEIALGAAPPYIPECKSFARRELRSRCRSIRAVPRTTSGCLRRKARYRNQRDIGFQFAEFSATYLAIAAPLTSSSPRSGTSRSPAACRSPRTSLDGLDVAVHLALVVGRAARVDVAIANGRLEGRRNPLIQRIGWLHIVMPVAQNRRLPGACSQSA